MGVNYRAYLTHTFLHDSVTLALLCLHQSFILLEHSMTKFWCGCTSSLILSAFNCSDNTGNMIWWEVSEVCYMNFIKAYTTTYSIVQLFSVWCPHILSHIPDSFIFVYVFLFNTNLEHKHEISFIYEHQYVTMLHHVSEH